MAKRRILFRTEAGRELALPVTPASYSVTTATQTETVNVHEVGEYVVPTYPALQTIKLSGILLPAHGYAFADTSLSPEGWVTWLEEQVQQKSRLRYIVSGTSINVPVYLTSVTYGERDGTGDLYADLTLREYRALRAVETQATATAATTAREAGEQTAETTYVVASGDTLWGIARKFYGDGSLCYKLAAYNGIANANLIYVGQVIRIPSAATLGATAASASSSSTVAATPTYTLTVTASGKAKNYGVVTVWTPKDATKWTLRGASGTVKLAQGTTFRAEIDENGHKAAKVLCDGNDRTGLKTWTYGVVRANHTLAITWEA